jgi:hypothetical protein
MSAGGVPSSGIVGTLGFGAAGAPSEPGSGAYCSWLVEALGSVLAGLSPAAYWLTPLLVGTLEPSPAACPGANVAAASGSWFPALWLRAARADWPPEARWLLPPLPALATCLSPFLPAF